MVRGLVDHQGGLLRDALCLLFRLGDDPIGIHMRADHK